MKLIDLTNKTIGSWTVLNKEPSKDGKSRWRVRCICGTENILASQNVRLGKGCFKCATERRIKIKPGDLFGDWCVIKRDVSNNGSQWMCRCKCDKEFVIPSKTLNSGTSTCCFECGRLKLRKFVNGFPQWLITQTKRSAKLRGLDFDLSIEYLSETFEKQSKLCILTGLPLTLSTAPKKTNGTTASIDRINNKKGYIVGNIRFVHKVVNVMRKDMSDEEFLYWCKLVVNQLR